MKKKPPLSDTPTSRWHHPLVRAPAPSASNPGAKPKWMKCGVLSGPKIPSDGFGMRLIIARGRVLAYVVGTRKDATFLELRTLLAPFGITHYYTDKAGVYQRHLPPEQHTIGKLSMQKIERKHLTLRTRLKRLARKTLCFSRSCLMPDLLLGLYMNYVEFGCTA
jgi:insertion element IS1 protein InsB